jgi:tetratricopeptide (TPR) repeat protein
MYIGFAAGNQDKSRTAARYQLAADSAMLNEDFASAKLYLERLIEQYPGNRETLFNIARAAEHTRDYPRMASAIRQLAPDDHPVHGPSHLWQATRLLSQKPVKPQDIRLAEKHLIHALALSESTPLAHDLLGQMYFQLGLWSQAIPHLDLSPDRSRRLMLAKAYSLAGQGEKGRSAAEQARDYFSREAAVHPQESKYRLEWAEACLFLEQFQDAVRVLRDTLATDDQPHVRRALARCYVTWADSLNEGNPKLRPRKFELLAAGVQIYPDEMALYDRLLKLLEAGGETSLSARQFLQANIVEGRAVGLSHLLLGAYAFTTCRTDEARLHMERAFDALPHADLVANNLAWLMIHSNPAQPERALSLIDPVVQRNPTIARFLDTRGHVLLKLRRPIEAVRDLEFAVAELKDNASTHEALATAYTELGLGELANMHLELSKKLNSTASTR